MRAVYIDRRDADLDLDGGALVVRVAGERLQDLPLGPLERLIVRGPARLTTRLLAELHARDVGLLLLGGKRGEAAGRLLGAPHQDVRLRLAQARLLDDASRRARLAAATLRAKLVAQRRLLAGLDADGRGERRRLLDAMARLDALVERLSEAAGPPALATLLGLEGAGSAAYFAAFQSAFAPALGFRERNRRPPRDPVNVALSLGYTLLHHEAVCAAHAAGLDPLVGVLHEPAPGRESLACDLVEPLRVHVDRFVLELFRARELRGEHFSRDGAACRLGKAGRERFYGAWEAEAPALRRLLRRAVRGLARELLPGEGGP